MDIYGDNTGLFTAQEIADKVGLDVREVYGLARDGVLPSYRGSRRRQHLFDLCEVLRVVQRGTCTYKEACA